MVARSTSVDALRLLLDRRTLLVGLGAASAAALLPNCGDKKSESTSTSDGVTPQWTVYASVQAAVRASPDMLTARAAKLIAAKDPTAAVRFVRDNITVLPPNQDVGDQSSVARWGPDATLRAGAGMLRERADVLSAMLVAMGLPAEVHYADLPTGIDAATLFASKTPAFSLDVDAIDIDDATRAQLKALPPIPDVDPAAVSTALLALIPAAQAVVAYPYTGLPTNVPVVQYSVGGATRWAYAIGDIDEVTTTPSGLGSVPGSALTYATVSMRLLASVGDLPGVATPTSLVELVRGQWTVDQLAGGRMLITTGSASPVATADIPADQVNLRVAAMSPLPSSAIEDTTLWTPRSATPPTPARGVPFTLSGAIYSSDGANPLVGPYGAVVQLDDADHATALAAVATLEAHAGGGAFPDVQLTVSALDGGGNPVFGLTQSDFAVTDEGVAELPVLLSNAGVDLKVMLSYDCSGSVTWPTPADKTTFDTALANALVTSAATTSFTVGYADVGNTPSSFAAPDAATIETGISGCSSGSNVWTTLGQVAPSAGVSAVVIVSDFVATDDPGSIPALAQRLAASNLSVAVVPISTDVDQTTVSAIVAACGATVLDWTAADFQQQLTTFVTAAAKRANASGYRSTYRLPVDQQTNQATRTVNVSLTARSSVSATATYTVPPVGTRGSIGIGGLYLELSVGNSPTTVRRLTGPMLDASRDPTPATTADYVATHAVLNGVITVGFEPGSPTKAANADELLTAFLSMQPLYEAANQPVSATLDAGAKLRPYSASMAGIVDPLPQTAVVPETVRVVIMIEGTDDTGFTRRFDVAPMLNLAAVPGSDAAAAFADTMRATIPLSFREGIVLTQSAADALTGAQLQYLPPYTTSSGLTGFSDADFAYWADVFDQYSSWHRLVPMDPSKNAMWVVDANTGTTVAVYVDGTGGGCAGAAESAALQNALTIFNIYCTLRTAACTAADGSEQCLGYTTASVIAAVGVLFAGLVLDTPALADLAMFVLTLLGAAYEGLGIISTATGGLASLLSAGSALHKCFGGREAPGF